MGVGSMPAGGFTQTGPRGQNRRAPYPIPGERMSSDRQKTSAPAMVSFQAGVLWKSARRVGRCTTAIDFV